MQSGHDRRSATARRPWFEPAATKTRNEGTSPLLLRAHRDFYGRHNMCFPLCCGEGPPKRRSDRHGHRLPPHNQALEAEADRHGHPRGASAPAVPLLARTHAAHEAGACLCLASTILSFLSFSPFHLPSLRSFKILLLQLLDINLGPCSGPKRHLPSFL